MSGFTDEQTVIYKLGQIESKLDLIAESIRSHIKIDETAHTASDDRITSLEKSRSWVLGAVAIISAGVSLIGSKLGIS